MTMNNNHLFDKLEKPFTKAEDILFERLDKPQKSDAKN